MNGSSVYDTVKSIIPVSVSPEVVDVVSHLVLTGLLLREIGEPVKYRRLMEALDKKLGKEPGTVRRLLGRAFAGTNARTDVRTSDYLYWVERELREVINTEN